MTDIYEILQSNNIEELKKYLESNFPDKQNINYEDRILIGDRVFFYMKNVCIEATIENADFQDVLYKKLEIILIIIKILFEYNPVFEYDSEEWHTDAYSGIYHFFSNFLWMYQHATYINKKQIYEIVVIFSQNKSFMKYIDIWHINVVGYQEGYICLSSQFYQIKTLFEFSEQIQSLQKKYSELEKENEMLKEQIYYAPDGNGAEAAKEHFIELSNEQEKN